MRAAPSRLFAVIVAVTAFGCATTRIQPHHLDDPSALVGKTVRLETAQGHPETIVVTRVEGTTVTGHRPSDSASAVRPPEELTFDLRTIAGLEGSSVATETAPAIATEDAATPAPPSAEVVGRHERWWLDVSVGDTVRLETKQGRTEVILVTRVERTGITGHRHGEPVSAVRGPDEVTFQFAEIQALAVDRSGKTDARVAGTIASGLARVFFGVAVALLAAIAAVL